MVFNKASCHKHKEGERQQQKANTKDHRNDIDAWEDNGRKHLFLVHFLL